MSTPDTETPETRRLPKEIYVLVAAAFIVALGYGIIAPVLPQFAASFNFGVTAATIVVSSFAFFRFVFSPSSGRPSMPSVNAESTSPASSSSPPPPRPSPSPRATGSC